jgi:hypothetical protein
VGRTIPLSVSVGLIVYMVVKAISWIDQWPSTFRLLTQSDHAIYMRQADRILAGGPLYPPWQLAGPYGLHQLPELYPPPAVYGLIVPLSLLPDPVWWIVPLCVVAAVVARWRPNPWALTGILFCLALPPTWVTIAAGNPAIWAAAAVAMATVWQWPGVFVLVKPSLAPFALIGIRSRSWWIALAGLGAVSLALLPAWLEYVTVIRNATEWSFDSSIGNVPLMSIPLIARWGRSSPIDTPGSVPSASIQP